MTDELLPPPTLPPPPGEGNPSIGSRMVFWLMIVALVIFLAAMVAVFAATRDDRRQEVDAVFERSLVEVTDVLGAPNANTAHLSHWHWHVQAGDCVWRRRALWNTKGGASLSQAAVDRIESIVLEERGFRVFPNEDELDTGDTRTFISGWDGYRRWMEAGDYQASSGTFELIVLDGRC